jgi:hypothetical protein
MLTNGDCETIDYSRLNAAEAKGLGKLYNTYYATMYDSGYYKPNNLLEAEQYYKGKLSIEVRELGYRFNIDFAEDYYMCKGGDLGNLIAGGKQYSFDYIDEKDFNSNGGSNKNGILYNADFECGTYLKGTSIYIDVYTDYTLGFSTNQPVRFYSTDIATISYSSSGSILDEIDLTLTR